MKTALTITVLIIALSVVVLLNRVDTKPSDYRPEAPSGLRKLSPPVAKYNSSPTPLVAMPLTADKPPIEASSLPMPHEMPSVPRDTGPFVDTDPNKFVAHPQGVEQPARDTGPFVDAGGPHTMTPEARQNQKSTPVTPPKPLQYP